MTTADSALLTAPTTRWWPGWLLPPATVLVIVVGAVLLLMTPSWMHFAQRESGARIPGIPTQQLRIVSDLTVNELLFGPGTFEFRYPIDCPEDSGCPVTGEVYTPDEASHLRDARLLLYVFLVPAAASLMLLVSTLLRRKTDPRVWRAVSRGGKVLVVGVVVLGVIGAVAFGPGFTLFHQIFFPGGNWQFPPDSMLIRLYPYAFWQLTSLALGVLCLIGGGLAWYVGRLNAERLEARP